MGNLLIIKNADFSEVAIEQITFSNMVRVNVEAIPDVKELVSGEGIYNKGKNAQISAISNDDYLFVRWNDGDTNAIRIINVGYSSPITYIAIFKRTLLLSASIMNNLPNLSYDFNTWISAALAKYYFENNKRIRISYIYVRPSSNIENLTLTRWNVPDEDTVPTAMSSQEIININSSMIDDTKGINGLYKIPVNIECIGSLVSLGSNDIYFSTNNVPADQYDYSGWWATDLPKSWNQRDINDTRCPVGVGYVVEPI